MARAKKEQKEPVEIIDDSVESEALIDEQVEMELSAEEIPEEEEAVKPARKRRSRKAKATEPVEEELELQADEEPVVEESVEELNDSSQVQTPKAPGEDFTRQWAAIAEISASISTNFERVSQQLKEMPAQYASAFQEALRMPTPKPAPITKVSVMVSAFALVLSILSISFSQSVRQTVLNKEVITAQAAIKSQTPPFEPEIARADLPKAREVVKTEAPVASKKKKKIKK